MKKASLLFEDSTRGVVAVRGPGRLWRGILLVVLIFLGTRLVIWTGAYYGAITLLCIQQQWIPPLSTYRRMIVWEEVEADSRQRQSATKLLADFEPLCRFDGVHYRSIIKGGYRYAPPPSSQPITSRKQVEQNIAFFPLYPLFCQPLTKILNTQAAMILTTHLCALAAAIVLYLWVRRRIDEKAALFSVAAVFCLPPACYYSFAYAESLTLLTIVSALWLIDRRAWIPAAIVCGLATATRPTALAIVAVYMLAYWFNNPGSRAGLWRRLVPLSVVAAGGLISYAVYLTIRFGSPLIYFANFRVGWVSDESRASWFEFLTLARVWDQFKYFGRTFRDFPEGLVNLANPLMWNMPLNFFILFLSLAGLSRVPRSFRPLLLFGPLIFIHSYMASGGATFGVEPIARYMAVAVPALVVLAAWCTREWKSGTRVALLAGMLLIQACWAYRIGLREWSG